VEAEGVLRLGRSEPLLLDYEERREGLRQIGERLVCWATPIYAGLRSQVFALCLLTPSRRARTRSFGASNSFIWKSLNGAQGRN